MPPLRRLPPLLWVRIQADLQDYLVNSGADGVQVIRWYHRQFTAVATERYLADEEEKYEFISGLNSTQNVLLTCDFVYYLPFIYI